MRIDPDCEVWLTEGDRRDVEDYLSTLSQGLTENGLNKLHLRVEHEFGPGGILLLLRQAWVTRIPRLLRVLARFGFRSAGYVLKRIPWFPGKQTMHLWLGEPKWRLHIDWFFRTHEIEMTGKVFVDQVRPGISHFESGHLSKKLIICFSPLSGAVSFPSAIFPLAGVKTGADVLVVRPARNQASPWLDVSSVPGGHEGLLSFLREYVESRGYEELHSMGLSFGSSLALVAGLRLYATTITTFGLTKTTQDLENSMPTEWRLAQSNYNAAQTVLTFVAGSKDARDARVAGQMRDCFPQAQMRLVAGAPHNPMQFLHERAELEAFLKDLLTGPRISRDVLPR